MDGLANRCEGTRRVRSYNVNRLASSPVAMRYYSNILETIGNTPLVQLPKIMDGVKGLVLAKLEMMNPGGSVKDRIGEKMIEDAEAKGTLKPGGTIIEPTSGNTGLGLAMVAAIKGYRAVFTMPDKMSREKIDLLKAFGARVVVTPTAVPPDHPDSYYRVAERIHRETPNSILPNQYANQANPRAHYETTGPEIWRDTDGTITHFVCGMGTGGTISGVGSYLKEQNPKVRIIGVDPLGSILKDYFYKKEMIKAHTYKIEGIGEDFIPESTWYQYSDEVVTIDVAARVREAVDMMRQYNVSQLPVLDTGILVGSLREEILMKALLEHPKMYDDYVAKVMEKPFPLVEPGADLEQVYKLLMR